MSSSPVDGVVGNRTLRVGQYVQAGTQLMAVVPTAAAYIVANYKETQLADVKPGQPVTIDVDMYSGRHGTRPCRQLGAGERSAVRAAAARQRDGQLHQDRAAHPGEDRSRPGERTRGRTAPRHVGLSRRSTPSRTRPRRRPSPPNNERQEQTARPGSKPGRSRGRVG